MGTSAPKPRFAINGFVVAYHPYKRLVLHYYPRTRSEAFAVCACDEAWRVNEARGCGSLDQALAIAEVVFEAPLRLWSVMPDELEPWKHPGAMTFEQKRLSLLAELRHRQHARDESTSQRAANANVIAREHKVLALEEEVRRRRSAKAE
jgi:hypothetical protein